MPGIKELLRSLQDDPLQELLEKGEIADRPVVVQLHNIEVLLLQQRQSNRMLEALWVTATVQRSIKQPGDEWCRQAAKFFHDLRRNWVQQAGFVRRPADQSNDLVELNLGQMVYKT